MGEDRDPKDSDSLEKLAEAVADGESIDWEKLGQAPVDDELRRLLQNLRLVSEVAAGHRAVVEDPLAEAATVGPVSDRPAHLGRVREPADDDVDPVPKSPSQWGDMVLLRKIGEGAFGEVFHAHDTWLDHPVALKLLKPEIAHSDSSARILQEARKLARVRHPNVVTVHGADMRDGRVGFWMDLIEGDTLADLVAAGRLSHGETMHIGQEICRALTAVHHVHMVHRDVKAQNVMRASDGGRIILMDFGAGEFMDSPSAMPRVRGTPLYLAPEVFEHGIANVSTDIYAAGVLLYHLVTGGFPVQGSSIAGLADAHKRGQRRRLRDERPDLPDSFVAIIERAIDPDPKRRFASAGEMYAALGGEEKRREDGGIRAMALRGGLAVAGVLAATEVFGLIGSRVFEGALRVDPSFGAGPSEYFTVGANALIPFAIVWFLAAAAYGALAGLLGFIWPRMPAIRRRWSALTPSLEPSTQAGLLLLAGVIGVVALTWSFSAVYTALTALALDPRPESLDLSILGTAGRQLQRAHSQGSAALSFLLGLAAWRWFPRLEKRASDPAHVRSLKWAVIVVALLVVALEAATRPIIWDDREVVSFGNQKAFVIGSHGEELLLYTPAKGERKYFRVRVDAPGLRRNVASRALFEQEPPG